jgi:hypothetical protein
MEGNFIAFFKEKHVIHTNMAKAALNIHIRPQANWQNPDLYECCGWWVTDEDPAELAK